MTRVRKETSRRHRHKSRFLSFPSEPQRKRKPRATNSSSSPLALLFDLSPLFSLLFDFSSPRFMRLAPATLLLVKRLFQSTSITVAVSPPALLQLRNQTSSFSLFRPPPSISSTFTSMATMTAEAPPAAAAKALTADERKKVRAALRGLCPRPF